MATVIAAAADAGFHLGQPWWLLGCALAVPVVWQTWRGVRTGHQRGRRITSTVLRVLVVLILAIMLCRPTMNETDTRVTLIVVVDRSKSVPLSLQEAGTGYVERALASRRPGDQLAMVDVAEVAGIVILPSTGAEIRRRNTSLEGGQSLLADGIQMAMAIAPPETATRILFVSDGNETEGDLAGAGRIAAANGIPIDVLPLQYDYKREVVFRRLAVPSSARSGQTVPLRFVLQSTGRARGKLLLTVNGQPVDLDPTGPALGAEVVLKAGTNVKTISLPVASGGMHEFQATFIPAEADQDGIAANNRAGAILSVSGPGHVLVVEGDPGGADRLVRVLTESAIRVERMRAASFPEKMAELVNTDAVILVNADNSQFSQLQQEMLTRYVTDLGGGLVMVGGPQAFGAGGWIGSPLAEILPVDLDPPQKKQMPKGALVLIMHACEMPRGNFWGKNVAIAAVNTLSRLDLVGVLDYGWESGDSNWVFPLGAAGDKKKVISAVQKMQMGDMPDFGAPMQEAYRKLQASDAVQKHIIIISDGDPSPPGPGLLKQMRAAGITCTGVGVFPHSASDTQSLKNIAAATGGRFYSPKDPRKLPQIFVKEAQVVRRALIVEQTFTPRVGSLSEILKGVGGGLPALDGYVLTGPGGPLTQRVLVGPEGEPILATGQAKLGRCVAFTSSADALWASKWLAWGGFDRFWEQTVRWVSRPAQGTECEVRTEVEGRRVTLTVDTAEDASGRLTLLTGVQALVVTPDMTVRHVDLSQVGPGRYLANFQAPQAGSYVINVRYTRADAKSVAERAAVRQTAFTVPYAPEFRDLKDNAAVLADLAATTGGRVLGGGDAEETDLFDRTGLKFPRTAKTLTEPMIFIWLVVFLLDVAVRKIAVDFRALGRRAVSLLSIKRTGKADPTVDRLLARKNRTRRQDGDAPARAGADDEAASRRYTASADALATLGEDDLVAGPRAPRDETIDEVVPRPQPPPKPAEPDSPVQRLLNAKRRAGRNRNTDNQSGDSPNV